jgi:hypothetical protein
MMAHRFRCPTKSVDDDVCMPLTIILPFLQSSHSHINTFRMSNAVSSVIVAAAQSVAKGAAQQGFFVDLLVLYHVCQIMSSNMPGLSCLASQKH